MREKKTIRERVGLPLKSGGAVLLFFVAMLMVLWAVIVLVRFFLGAA